MSRAFIDKVVGGMHHVSDFSWAENGLCNICKSNGERFHAGFIWEHNVQEQHVSSLREFGPDFIASVPKGAFWDGPAIGVCEANNIGWGGIGTLTWACEIGKDPKSLSEKTTSFARRVIRQHERVVSASHINSLLLEVLIDSGVLLKVALLDAYDLTSEELRTAWDRFGRFDIAFKNNPNGGITKDAYSAARQLGVKVMNATQFLGYLKHVE